MKKNKFFIIFTALLFTIGVNNVNAADDVYNNYEKVSTVVCGNNVKLPSIVPTTVSALYTIVQIAIPVLLIILGMMDLFKAITANKEDEITKARGLFFKRLISAVLVFMIMLFVKLMLSAFSNDSASLVDCMDCVIRNKCGYVSQETDGVCYLISVSDNQKYGFKVNLNGDVTIMRDSSMGNYNYVPYSEFKPTRINECPNPSDYELVIKAGNVPNQYNFRIVRK